MSYAASDIATTRILPFSRQLVFAAFSNPQILARWWGPAGFTNTVTEFEFRVGGIWKIIMHSPDETDYPNESKFFEIHEPERIVFNHLHPIHGFRMEMIYSEVDEGTRLTWSMRFDDPAEAAKHRSVIQQANEQNFDRLEAALAETNSSH